MSAQILNRHFTMTSAGNWQKKKGLERAAAEIPEGLDVATREDEKYKYLFVQNYGAEPAAFPMDTETYQPMTGEYDGVVRRFETVVFRKEK